MTIQLDGFSLSLSDVARVAAGGAEVVLTEEAKQRVDEARALVDRHAQGEAPVYGVNTGFGYLARVRVPKDDLAQLQLN